MTGPKKNERHGWNKKIKNYKKKYFFL